MIRRKVIEWSAEQIRRWDYNYKTVLPDTGDTVWEAQAKRYREKHRILRALDTLKLLLAIPPLLLLFTVTNWLERIGFGPWLRAKLGTGK